LWCGVLCGIMIVRQKDRAAGFRRGDASGKNGDFATKQPPICSISATTQILQSKLLKRRDSFVSCPERSEQVPEWAKIAWWGSSNQYPAVSEQ
jgi:hypothetical protein